MKLSVALDPGTTLTAEAASSDSEITLELPYVIDGRAVVNVVYTCEVSGPDNASLRQEARVFVTPFRKDVITSYSIHYTKLYEDIRSGYVLTRDGRTTRSTCGVSPTE